VKGVICKYCARDIKVDLEIFYLFKFPSLGFGFREVWVLDLGFNLDNLIKVEWHCMFMWSELAQEVSSGK